MVKGGGTKSRRGCCCVEGWRGNGRCDIRLVVGNEGIDGEEWGRKGTLIVAGDDVDSRQGRWGVRGGGRQGEG